MDPESIPGTLCVRPEYTLDGTPVHHMTSYTHSHTLGNLEFQIQHQVCFVGVVKKLKNVEETHKKHKEELPIDRSCVERMLLTA